MTPLEAINRELKRRKRLTASLAREALRLWRRIDPVNIAASWTLGMQQLLVLLVAAMEATARDADRFTHRVLEAQGIDPEPVAQIRPAAFAESASDGRALDTLLMQPVVTAKTAIAAGATPVESLASGWSVLEMILATQLADIARAGTSVGMATRPRCTQYVRALVAPSCSRCVVLAGKESWSTACQRHPKCDCIAVPSDSRNSKDLTVNPRTHFDRMAREEQDRVFTQAGAQAIRDGADIGRVVNARRRAAGLTPAQSMTAIPADLRAARGDFTRGRLRADEQGRFLTAELTGRNQRVVRLLPESIYQIAGGNRDLAIQLLAEHRYIYRPGVL